MIYARVLLAAFVVLAVIYYVMVIGQLFGKWKITNREIKFSYLCVPFYYWMVSQEEKKQVKRKKIGNQKPINKGKILGIIIAVFAVLLVAMAGALWDYKTAVGVAEALANSKVQWVPSVMFGGNGSGNNAMDAVGLKMLMDITKSFDKK